MPFALPPPCFIPAINTGVVPLYSFYHCTYFMWEVDSNLFLFANFPTDGRMISWLCARTRCHHLSSVCLSLSPICSRSCAGIFGFIRGVSRHSSPFSRSLSLLRDLSDRRRNFQNGTGRSTQRLVVGRGRPRCKLLFHILWGLLAGCSRQYPAPPRYD